MSSASSDDLTSSISFWMLFTSLAWLTWLGFPVLCWVKVAFLSCSMLETKLPALSPPIWCCLWANYTELWLCWGIFLSTLIITQSLGDDEEYSFYTDYHIEPWLCWGIFLLHLICSVFFVCLFVFGHEGL
jgi:hypothetical protein